LKRPIKVIIALLLGAVIATGAGASACDSDADVASSNLSKDADNFKILRRIVFYNGISGEYILQVEGYCSLGNDDPQYKLTVTCKVGEGQFKKHFLGLSDNVTYFAEQIEAAGVSTSHYKVVFKPSAIVPDPEKR
jgi:hypothetical protein